MTEIEITKVDYFKESRVWKVELSNGFLTKFCSKFPPYKVGDKIISVWHFDNYCSTVLK